VVGKITFEIECGNVKRSWSMDMSDVPYYPTTGMIMSVGHHYPIFDAKLAQELAIAAPLPPVKYKATCPSTGRLTWFPLSTSRDFGSAVAAAKSQNDVLKIQVPLLPNPKISPLLAAQRQGVEPVGFEGLSIPVLTFPISPNLGYQGQEQTGQLVPPLADESRISRVISKHHNAAKSPPLPNQRHVITSGGSKFPGMGQTVGGEEVLTRSNMPGGGCGGKVQDIEDLLGMRRQSRPTGLGPGGRPRARHMDVMMRDMGQEQCGSSSESDCEDGGRCVEGEGDVYVSKEEAYRSLMGGMRMKNGKCKEKKMKKEKKIKKEKKMKKEMKMKKEKKMTACDGSSSSSSSSDSDCQDNSNMRCNMKDAAKSKKQKMMKKEKKMGKCVGSSSSSSSDSDCDEACNTGGMKGNQKMKQKTKKMKKGKCDSSSSSDSDCGEKRLPPFTTALCNDQKHSICNDASSTGLTEDLTTATQDSTSVRVCTCIELKENNCKVVTVNGDEVGVWRVKGQVYAIGNRCSHKNAKLSLGDIEDIGGGPAVKCPKHRGKFGGGLLFSLEDGHSFTPKPCSSHKACWAVKTYHVFEKHGVIYVREGSPPPESTNKAEPKAPASAVAMKADTLIANTDSIVAECSSPPMESVWRVDHITEESSDTRIFHLVRPGTAPCDVASSTVKPEPGGGLWHVSVTCPKGLVSREYTPVSSWSDHVMGNLDLLIKIYEGGELTGNYLRDVKEGDYLEVSEPEPTLDDGQEVFLSESGELQLGCVAGGTGITPIVQAIMSMKAKCKRAQVSLLYSSRTVQDILMRRDLDNLEHACKESGVSVGLDVVHTLTQSQSAVPEKWDGKLGRINGDMLLEVMPKPTASTRILLCGPRGMLEASRAYLLQLGYSDDMIIELDA